MMNHVSLLFLVIFLVISPRSQSYSINWLASSRSVADPESYFRAMTLKYELERLVIEHTSAVLKQSTELKAQAMGIAIPQVDLFEGQGTLKEKLYEGMARVQESYENFNQEIDRLQETVDVMKEMNKVGQVMFSQMHSLQGKTDDIVTMAGISIDKQQELLQKQSMALDNLKSLSKEFQKSRIFLQRMVYFTQGQRQELLQQKDQLLRANDHLANNSRSILAPQAAGAMK